MTPSNAKKPSRKAPQSGAGLKIPDRNGELVLHGDLADLTYAFVGSPRRLVTCPVPDSVYQKLQNHPGGVGRFYEEAVAAFDGNLNSLVTAAVTFVDARRFRAAVDPPRNASGRVLPATFAKVEQIQQALVSIRGMSRAKVLAGLVQLHLGRV